MEASRSFAVGVPLAISPNSVEEHGNFIAGLTPSQLLERLFREYLFRFSGPQAATATTGIDPLEYVEALAGCQPIEALYRFLAGRDPLAMQVTFNILGRLPNVKQLANLGVSLSSVESSRESLRHRLNLLKERGVPSAAGTYSQTVKNVMLQLAPFGLTGLYAASRVTATQDGSSFAGCYEDLVSAVAEAQGEHTWEIFGADMKRGVVAADLLAAMIDDCTDALPSISSQKTIAELFPWRNGLVLQAKDILLKQQKELEECQREATKEEVAKSLSVDKMTSIHAHWANFITGTLSGKADVAMARHMAASVGWVAKVVVFENVLQPWVPLAKGAVFGKAASQEVMQNLRDATSYVMDSCSFEDRVDLFHKGIVGAADEPLPNGKELYAKLQAIHKHAPPSVTWRAKPIEISSSWDVVMSKPGIVAGSPLACITKDSRFEVACWLVSCLCVAELYQACMVTPAVALMGVTSTGKSSLIQSIAVNRDAVIAGGLASHRTSVPLLHECRPFAKHQSSFSVLDVPGHTDRENKRSDAKDGDSRRENLPGEECLPMTHLCSALAVMLPHRLPYVKSFCKQLELLVEKGRLAETGSVKVFITKCEDVIDEILLEKDPATALRNQLQEEVTRIGMPSVVGMANTHYAVVLNPRMYRSEDLQRLGVWEWTDIHRWMSDQCNRERQCPPNFAAL